MPKSVFLAESDTVRRMFLAIRSRCTILGFVGSPRAMPKKNVHVNREGVVRGVSRSSSRLL